MARKGSKSTRKAEEVVGDATTVGTGPGTPAAGKPRQAPPGTPGNDLTVEELGGMAAGTTRIRIKVDFSDLRGPDVAD